MWVGSARGGGKEWKSVGVVVLLLQYTRCKKKKKKGKNYDDDRTAIMYARVFYNSCEKRKSMNEVIRRHQIAFVAFDLVTMAFATFFSPCSLPVSFSFPFFFSFLFF